MGKLLRDKFVGQIGSRWWSCWHF